MSQFTLYEGDSRAGLLSLPADHLHTVVTSIPYFGLRSYGTMPQVWGGDPLCAHAWGPDAGRYNPTKHSDRDNNGKHGYSPLGALPGGQGAWCGLCAAWRGELGSEPTPDLFVAHIVEVFRAVWHALRTDGTVWLNIGDSYNSGTRFNAQAGLNGKHYNEKPADGWATSRPLLPGVGDKQLLLMPARVALALQADGWTVRSEIIWAKPNPMPESVTDRPTKAHEQIYLLTKGPKYFYDADAIRERGNPEGSHPRGDNPKTDESRKDGDRFVLGTPTAGRNARTVWSIASQPYPDAHFATFPEELPRRCILAGTSAKGCCSACGAPWRRVVAVERSNYQATNYAVVAANGAISGGVGKVFPDTARQTTGWEPTCRCAAAIVPCRVGDPFLGSGTTAAVAIGLGRAAWGSELQPAYVPLIRARVAAATPWYAVQPLAAADDVTDLPLFAQGAA